MIRTSAVKKIILVIFFLLAPTLCLAQIEDFEKSVDTQYFTICYHSDDDLLVFVEKFNLALSSQLASNYSSADTFKTPGERIADLVNALFLKVSDILGIHLYSYHGKIKLCKTHDELSNLYYHYFKSPLAAEAFYFKDKESIYIALPTVELSILGHEMGHAIMCNYFAVTPPIRLQEILAKYIEYSLRKGGI
ncbi:unnamed protein product [marine sediment metagenome]|uniref:Peptidase MA-like domain-containing protein n=1 Tax=marine sediment metagenome TaxID=412755 RepID=X1DZ35_9ZZZZ